MTSKRTLEEYVSKEVNQKELQHELRGSLVGHPTKSLTLDFETSLGIRLDEQDKPVIEAFVASANKPVKGSGAADTVEIKDIQIKKGKAVITFK